MSRARTLLLAALFLAPLLPFASAGAPQPATWSPYDTISAVNDVALAASGTALAAALTQASTAATDPILGGTAGSRAALGDLAILDAENGFAYNGSSATQAPFGRTHVAVSANGASIASLGFDVTPAPDVRTPNADAPGDAAPNVAALRLYFQRLVSGTSWRPESAATNRSMLLDVGAPVDLLTSADGNRVLLAYNYRGNMTVQGFAFANDQLASQWRYRVPGTVYDLAATTDLAVVAVAAQVTEGNATYGALFTIPWTFGNPTETSYDRTANGTAYRSAAISPDGSRVYAGTATGGFHVIAAKTATPYALANATEPVRHLAISTDGRRLVAASGAVLAYYDVSGPIPLATWTTVAAGIVNDIAVNRTGGLLVAAINGSGGSALGYGEAGGEPLWRLGAGTTNSVAVDAEGTRVAYGKANFVFLVNVGRQIGLAHPGGVDEGPTQIVPPQGTATFELDVRNAGAGIERIVFTPAPGFDVTLASDPAVVTLRPDEVQRVKVHVTVGRFFQGTQSFNITAVSQASAARDDTTLSLKIQARTNVSLVLNGSDDRNLAAGEGAELLLGIVNDGGSDVAVGLRAIQSVTRGDPWKIDIDPASLTIAAKSVTTVRASVTPPQGATNGTANAITFILEGPDVTDQVQVALRINPSLGVEIDAPGRVKFVEPGRQAHYNVTVTNTGSLPRQFEVFYEVTPQGGKNWAVDMATQPVRLDAGATKTIPVVIFAPGDATPTDRVSVLITARSVAELVNETLAASNLTLFANAVPPTPTTTTPTTNITPGPGVALAVGALAVLAITLRRSRRDP